MGMRRRLLLGVLALGLVAAGSATAYGSLYRPLAEGSASGFLESRETDGYGEREPWVVPYRDRTLVRAILSLRNDGRWPVRVEHVGESNGADWHGLLEYRPDQNVLNPPNVYAYEGPAFTPFTLRPDEERSVSVALWLDHCEYNSAGGSMTFSEVPVRYRAFGMTHTARIRLEKPWEIVYEKASQCPRPAVR